MSHFKTDTYYSMGNIVNQGIQGCWFWDIVHWISHRKPALWVSDNTSKLPKLSEIVWAYHDVAERELCEINVMSQCETWMRSSLWCHWEVNVTFQFEVTMNSCCDLSMRLVWDHCDGMVIQNCSMRVERVARAREIGCLLPCSVKSMTYTIGMCYFLALR